MIERFDGTACTRCGCRDTETLREPSIVTASNGSAWPIKGCAICNHCRREFLYDPEPEPKPVARMFAGPSCSECGSHAVKVVRTINDKEAGRKIRYHKCRECEATFKTSETAPPEDADDRRVKLYA